MLLTLDENVFFFFLVMISNEELSLDIVLEMESR